MELDMREKRPYERPWTTIVELRQTGMLLTVSNRENYEIVTDNPFAGAPEFEP